MFFTAAKIHQASNLCCTAAVSLSKLQITGEDQQLQHSFFSIINLVDNTKLSCYTLSPTQHQSFFRNLPPLYNIVLFCNYVLILSRWIIGWPVLIIVLVLLPDPCLAFIKWNSTLAGKSKSPTLLYTVVGMSEGQSASCVAGSKSVVFQSYCLRYRPNALLV